MAANITLGSDTQLTSVNFFHDTLIPDDQQTVTGYIDLDLNIAKN
jgi:hypothetical protein